jgi:hypothetical protein
VARARERFAEVIRSAAHEPQPIYNRDQLVGVVVDPESYAEFLRWREERAHRSVGAALEELRALCREEGYELEAPRRADRSNPFAADDEG